MKIRGNRGSGDFEPPPEGLWNAVCVDVVDEGMREVTWEGKTTSRHEVRITWMLECEMEDVGKNYIISKWYNVGPDPDDLYMSPKSNIWKDLCSWRGKEFTDEELAGFELESIVGKTCRILVTEYTKRDGTRGAKAERVMKAVPGASPIDFSDYVRVQDREEKKEGAGSEVDVEDDDIPF